MIMKKAAVAILLSAAIVALPGCAVSGGGKADPPMPSENIDFSELRYCLDEFKSIDGDLYTLSSHVAYAKAASDGASLLIDENVTQNDVDTAVEVLIEARDALEPARYGGDSIPTQDLDGVYTSATWPDEIEADFVVLKNATTGGGPSYNGVKGRSNPVGSGTFFWVESLINSKFDTYSLDCWLVNEGAVFHLNNDSKAGVHSAWPEDNPDAWASTNLPEDFRIIVDRDTEAQKIIESLGQKTG